MAALDVLQVRPPPDDDDDSDMRARIEALPDPLPKPPFLWVLMGSVRSGKSVFISNVIHRWYGPLRRPKRLSRGGGKPVFSRIVYCSPTVEQDASLWHLRDPALAQALDAEVAVVSGHRLDDLDASVEAIVENKMAAGATRREQWLIVLDDCLGLLRLSGPKAFVTHFATRYRHARVSLLISCQQLRALPPTIRANASAYCIWRSANGRERSKLEEEFGEVVPDFLRLYDEATAEPYHFLFLDLRRLRAFADLTRPLFDAST